MGEWIGHVCLMWYSREHEFDVTALLFSMSRRAPMDEKNTRWKA